MSVEIQLLKEVDVYLTAPANHCKDYLQLSVDFRFTIYNLAPWTIWHRDNLAPGQFGTAM